MAGPCKITISVDLFPLGFFPRIHSNSRKSSPLPYTRFYTFPILRIHVFWFWTYKLLHTTMLIIRNCMSTVRYLPGNSLLTGGGITSSQSSTSNKHSIIIGAVLGSILGVAFVLGIILYFFCQAKRNAHILERGSLGKITFKHIPTIF